MASSDPITLSVSNLNRRESGRLLDPRGSGLLFFMFIRPQPYTCLGIECSLCEAATIIARCSHARVFRLNIRDPSATV
jgi:hypothetical protein